MATVYYAKTDNVDLSAAKMLTAARRARVDRLKRIEDKKLAIAAELLLQRACHDQGIAFLEEDLIYPEKGKPHFIKTPLKFSYSHSKEVTVCAIGSDEVGVDIEMVRPHHQKIAVRFLSDECQSRIFSAPDPDVAFIDEWMKIESHAKATGLGIARPPFDVPPEKEWFFTTASVLEGYHICICHKQIDAPIHFTEVSL